MRGARWLLVLGGATRLAIAPADAWAADRDHRFELALGGVTPLRNFAAADGATAKLQTTWFGEGAFHVWVADRMTLGGALSVAPANEFAVRSGADPAAPQTELEFAGPDVWRATMEARTWNSGAHLYLGLGGGLAYYRSEGIGCASYEGNRCFVIQEYTGGYTRPLLHLSAGVFGIGLRTLGLRIEDFVLLQGASSQHDVGGSVVYAIPLR